MGSIRPPRPDELEALRAIEVAAGASFADVGLPEVAADDPPALDVLEAYRRAGRTWVAAVGDEPAGYVLVDVLDGAAHIEQVSVHPRFAGRALGRQLIDHVAGWAAEHGCAAVTLTTFRDVPWNAPYYERRCGFRVLAGAEIGPELAARMRAEARHGLDPTRRCAMVRPHARRSEPG